MQSNAQIEKLLRQKTGDREIPGVVAMAANANEVIYQGAYGKRDLSKDDAMTSDSVCCPILPRRKYSKASIPMESQDCGPPNVRSLCATS